MFLFYRGERIVTLNLRYYRNYFNPCYELSTSPFKNLVGMLEHVFIVFYFLVAIVF